jgi:outer membrane protein TolC
MGVMDGAPLRLTTEPEEGGDPAALRADSLVAAALAAHPRIAQGEAAASAAARRTRASRWDRLPSLSLRAGYARDQSDLDYDALRDFASPSDSRLSLSLGVSIPLFDQFRTTATLAQARADEVRTREELRAAQLAVESEVRAAHLDVGNAHRGSALAARTAQLARERLALAQEQYQIGAVTFTDLQDAVDRAAKAERDALAARYDLAVARATLEEKAGAPLAPR